MDYLFRWDDYYDLYGDLPSFNLHALMLLYHLQDHSPWTLLTARRLPRGTGPIPYGIPQATMAPPIVTP